MCENRLDPLIGTGAEGQGPAAGRFQPLAAVAFPQPHDAATRPEALWRLGTRGENGLHHPCGGGPTVGRPADEPLGRPGYVMTVGRGHVRRDGAVAPFEARAQVAGHAGAFMEEFDHLGTHAYLKLLLDEGIRH